MRFFRTIALTSIVLLAYAAQAEELQTLKIGVDASYPPFSSMDATGEIVGFEIDYATALCAKMKVKCTFQNQDFDGIIPALLAKKFDVIVSSMSITEERAQRVLFSDMYYATAPAFMTSKDNASDDISPEALAGKTLGAQSSSVFANYLDKIYSNSDIKLYPSQEEENLDLLNGRLDYVHGDQTLLQAFVEKHDNCCRVITFKRDPVIFGPGVGAAFRPEDTELAAQFNKAIAEADADGTYDKIEKKYFNFSIRGK